MLPHQREFHNDLHSKFLHISGGYGCVKDSTLIKTPRGLIPISEIRKPQPVLSWNEKSNQFQLSLSTGAYPKGKANLYRVVHEHGEFVASEFHQVFCADYKYRPLRSLSVGDKISYSKNHLDSNFYDLQKSSLLNDEHLKQTIEDFLHRYEGDTRLYGQQLLSFLNNALSVFPLQNDALKFCQSNHQSIFERMDVRLGQELAHSHRDQLLFQTYESHLIPQTHFLDNVLASCTLTSASEYTFGDSQSLLQSAYLSAHHHKELLFFQDHTSLCSTLPIAAIKSIEKLPYEEWFWDMHVFETNNYITGDGAIHHNSGKTYSLCMKAIKMRWINRLFSGGLVTPSYPELKKDVLPTFESILEENRIPYTYHQTDKIFSFPWCKGKLFLFTAEKKIRGPNFSDMGINEAALIDKERYLECIGRVRVKGAPCPQIYSSSTPEGMGNYLYELFVEKPMSNSRIIYAKTMDNIENIDPAYIESLKASYDSLTLQAYLNGEWVNMNGNQFYYSYNASVNEDRTLKRDHNKLVLVGLDFNVDHMTATIWHYDNDGLKGFDEIYLERNADTQKMCEALKARGYTPDITTIYPDPAGKARSTKGAPDHEILRREGFNVVSRLSAPRMRERQLNMNNKLEKGWIKYNPDTMPKLRKDFLSVEQNPVTLEKSKDDPRLTHASDGLDYLVDVLSPFNRPSRMESVTFR